MGLSPDNLAQLHAKYVEMLRLRLLHERGEEPDAIRDRARLSATFPGALREMDELPTDAIRGRIHALEAALEEPALALPWMRAVAMFHELAKGALAAKKWLAGKKEVTPEMRGAFALAALGPGAAWAEDLDRIARPPRGRLMDLVFERIAHTLEVSPREARRLVFLQRRFPRD